MSSDTVKTQSLHFLELIGNKRDIITAAILIHPVCQFIHDDEPPKSRDSFLEFWPKMMARAPHFHVEVRDIIVQDNRAWVFSKITGRPDGTSCDDIHMFEFDSDGKCLKSQGVQRVI